MIRERHFHYALHARPMVDGFRREEQRKEDTEKEEDESQDNIRRILLLGSHGIVGLLIKAVQR